MKPKLLLYCCKAKPYLYKTEKPMIEKMNGDYHIQLNEAVLTENLNGKIVAECDFDVEEIDFASQRFYENDIEKYNIEINKQNEWLKRSCLTATQMVCYLDKKGKGQTNLNGYAIHIKNLHIFDKPRELEDYEDEWEYPLEKAPQNMRRCYSTLYSNIEADMPIKTDSYILTSIKPEWLCKILNGEKTIEVRNKVLKEMLE